LPCGIVEHVFEGEAPDVLVGEIEASQRAESAVMARRCAAIAALLVQRTLEAEEVDPDYAWSMTRRRTALLGRVDRQLSTFCKMAIAASVLSGMVVKSFP
jgi:hypothetical protein